MLCTARRPRASGSGTLATGRLPWVPRRLASRWTGCMSGISALCSLLLAVSSNLYPPSLVSSLSSLRTPLVSLFSFLQAIFKTPGVMAMITGVFHCLPLAIHWRFPTHSLAFPGLSMTSTTFH